MFFILHEGICDPLPEAAWLSHPPRIVRSERYTFPVGRHLRHGDGCGGTRNGVYARVTGSSGRRWVRLGTICLRCNAFWPLDPDVTAGEIVARALDRQASPAPR